MTGQVCGCVFSPVFLAVLFLLVFFLKFRYEHGGETVKVKDGAKSKFKKNHVAFSSSQRPDRRNGAGVTITKRTSLTWETRGRVTTHTGAPSQPLCACPRDPPPPPPAVSTYSRATPDNGLTLALKRQSSTHLCGQSSALMDWTQNKLTFLKVLTSEICHQPP